MSVKRSSHAIYDCTYHLVWATKYRKPILQGLIKTRVRSLLSAIASQYDMTISRTEIVGDHIHLVIEVPPKLALSRAAQILKSLSTKYLFKEFPSLKSTYWGGECWVGGYFVRTVGNGITKDQIHKYLDQQTSPPTLFN